MDLKILFMNVVVNPHNRGPSPPSHPRDHPGERHVDVRVERLQHRLSPEVALQADQLQRGYDLVHLPVAA